MVIPQTTRLNVLVTRAELIYNLQHWKMPVLCDLCSEKAVLKRPKSGRKLCKNCFYYMFEEEIHRTIIDADLFTSGETVAIGASGKTSLISALSLEFWIC